MSASCGPSGHGGRGGAAQDFELNLASIIDCFTVLIAFMLATASFLSIGIIDAGIAAGGTEAKSKEPPPVVLTIEIKQDLGITIKASGKTNQSFSASNKEELAGRLAQIKSQWPTLQAATLVADNKVEYKEVIGTMEVIRKQIPAVMLGGF